MNLLLSYNWIKEYVDTNLDVKNFARSLSLKGPSIEKWYPYNGNDYILDIEITANRPDMASVIGIAREASVILDTSLKEPKYNNVFVDIERREIGVSILNKQLCSRYQTVVMKNVEIKESPKWLKSRLEASGIKSINNIVDITNYVLLEYGQPTHVFDFDKIVNKKIIVRTASNGEIFTSLDNKNYKLTTKDLVIADTHGVIGLAGIKGGKKAEVDENTKNIVFESANFDPTTVRKTSRRLDLKTEASTLFERNLNPNHTDIAIKRLIDLTKKYAKGQVVSKIVDKGNKNRLKLNKIKFNPEIVNDILGIAISKNEIIKILKKLGFHCEKKDKYLQVTVPYFRTEDVIKDYDLVEEIARIYGYEKIPSELPQGEIPIYKTDPRIYLEDKIKEYLSGQGFIEIFAYSMISERQLELVGINPKDTIRLINPLNDNFEFMRTELTSSLLEVVETNEAYREKLKIFELNKVYLKKDNKSLPTEQSSLALAINGENPENIFYELKGIWEYITQKLNLDNNKINYVENDSIQYNQICKADILYQKENLGSIGIINEKIREKLGLKKNLAILEINLDKLFKISRKLIVSYTPLPKYPAVSRDFAFIVNTNQKWREIYEQIKKIVGDLFVSCKIFDIYKGRSIDKNKKSIAFNIIMQSSKRTLQDEEINKLSQNIIDSLTEKFDAEIRK